MRVYPITDSNVEILFWIAVIFSNSLGTAFDDYLTDNAGLSYMQGAFVTASIIGVVLALHYATRINEVALFWIAFIFTRPFGATFGDFLTKPLESGGLNMPPELVSLATLALLGGMLVFSVKSHNLYNFEGLRAFKEKFSPEWRPHYLAIWGGVDSVLVATDVNALVSGGLEGALFKSTQANDAASGLRIIEPPPVTP